MEAVVIFASFTVPEIKGYHASMPIVPEVTPIKDIQGKPQNAKNLTVLYDAEDRTIEIVFVDGDGNVVEPQYPITGKTGETVPVTDGRVIQSNLQRVGNISIQMILIKWFLEQLL